MKKIHIIPTDKPSRLVRNSNENTLKLCIQTLPLDKEIYCYPQHIYITSDEEIKEGDWMIRGNEQPIKVTKDFFWDFGVRYYKIILTTDQDLIKDGVQPIDDDFLEWFVKNPSCEEVEVNLIQTEPLKGFIYNFEYKIVIPKEEPKKDPLEQAAKEYAEMHLDVSGNLGKYLVKSVFQDGAKWQINLKKNNMKQETLEEVELAILFHNTYEKLAPSFGYETRLETRSFETNTPNGNLMIAVCKEIIKWQQERMYSEEEVIELLTKRCEHFGTSVSPFDKLLLKQDLEWFNNIKKK